MSAATCGQPLSLAHIPLHQVIRLAGVTGEQLAVSLDPLPDGAPVVLRFAVPDAVPNAHVVIGDVLGRLESLALNLFPAWLPRADVITDSSDFDRRTVREMAHQRAAESVHFGPFLAELAEAALTGHGPPERFAPELRLRGLAGIIADSYGRGGVVLLVGPNSSPAGEDEQRHMAMEYEWLVTHGDVGVWLLADALPLVDRYQTWQLSVPGYVDALSAAGAESSPAPEFPALAGRPHPGSVAEQTLERSLARCEWALGRAWNQEYASHSLAPPIRVDLMWPAERCVVEIDGPDHRGGLKYAADRRRDNGLTLDGFAVLRFTNDEILDDPAQVLATIETMLGKKRSDEGNQL